MLLMMATSSSGLLSRSWWCPVPSSDEVHGVGPGALAIAGSRACRLGGGALFRSYGSSSSSGGRLMGTSSLTSLD